MASDSSYDGPTVTGVEHSTGVACVVDAPDSVRHINLLTGARVAAAKSTKFRPLTKGETIGSDVNFREKIKSGTGVVALAKESEDWATVTLTDKAGHSRVLLSDRYNEDSGAGAEYSFTKYTPDLSLILIQQRLDEDNGSDPDNKDAYPGKVYMYDSRLEKAVSLASGRVAAARVTGRDTMVALVETHSVDFGLRRWMSARSRLLLYKLGSGKPLINRDYLVLTDTDGGCGRLSPNGSNLAIVRLVKDSSGELRDMAIETVNLSTGAVTLLAATTRRVKPELIWIDDHTLAYTTCDKYWIPQIWIADTRSGQNKLAYSNPEFGVINAIGCHPSGRRLVFQACSEPLVRLANYQSLWVLNINTGQALKLADDKEAAK